jgi:hypothetical protein
MPQSHTAREPITLEVLLERRDAQHLRIPITRPVVIVHGDVRIEAQTLDVSVGGMRVACAAILREGAPLRVFLSLPAPYHDLDLAATVRWSREGAMGLQFGTPRARDTWALNALTRGDDRAAARAAASGEK